MLSHFNEIINVKRKVYDSLIVAAAESLPCETGGVVYSYTDRNGYKVQDSRVIFNVHNNAETNYAGSPQETLALYEKLGKVGGSIDFVWHSHPTAGKCPSDIDKRMHYPSHYLAIVSFDNGAPQLNLWRVENWKETSWQVI